jgi:NAD(P)-dependent dehydrogenase (short-subunit alcohol dehydrogenase family)
VNIGANLVQNPVVPYHDYTAAKAVLFFASPWARSVTGQNLVVDGGLVKD